MSSHDPSSSPNFPVTAAFFAIPELARYLARFLRPHDIVHLRQTCKFLYNEYHDIFWSRIDLLNDPDDNSRLLRLLHSQASAKAFACNVNAIRSLSCQGSFLAHYTLGLCVLIDTKKYFMRPGVTLRQETSLESAQYLVSTVQELMKATSTELKQHQRLLEYPNWLPHLSIGLPFSGRLSTPAIYTANAKLLFAPIRNLTRLECSMAKPVDWAIHPCRTPIDSETLTSFLCWALYMNKGLAHINVVGLHLSYKYDRIFAWTLSGLSHLITLRLSAQYKMNIEECLLFYCSDTLELFHLRREMEPYNEDYPILIEPWRDFTLTKEYMDLTSFMDCGPLATLRRPMPFLKSLRLFATESIGYKDKLCPILENCPALEELYIPTIGKHPFALAKTLKVIEEQRIPIKKLWIDFQEIYERSEEVPIGMIKGLEKNTLQMLNISFFHQESLTGIITSILRHSETLRDITFQSTICISSVNIENILHLCHSLERFIISPDDYRDLQHISLSISFSVAKPWICLKLVHLEIPVLLDWVPSFIFSQGSYRSKWHHEWKDSLDDIKVRGTLEQFYGQIGQLHQLQVLDLKACLPYCTPYDGQQELAPFDFGWQDISLPGMLIMPLPLSPPPIKTVRSPEINQHRNTNNKKMISGFLNLLSGLTRLRELRGSVRMKPLEMTTTVRLDTYRWIATHWPKLQVAEFLEPDYQDNNDFQYPPHMAWLFTERPLLKLAAEK